ncbi:hypothetical protein GCM10009722_32750 [Williamsia deligens]|nr:hypothetical protein [Williamsia deligens]
MLQIRLRLWRALLAVLVLAAGVVVTSMATTASAQSTTPVATTRSDDGAPPSMTPAGLVLAHDAGRQTPAGMAIAALVGPHPLRAEALIPPGFAAAEGYQPIVDAGVPANPDGGCSSPIALPAAFDAPCKTHDLGYDLLRYSAMTGSTQGPWAREAIDAQLVRRVTATCEFDDNGCSAAAELVRAGVVTNSRRQAEGVPGVETPWQIAGSVVKLVWIPVVRVADAVGTPVGRAAAAALLAWALTAVWRSSRRAVVLPTLPTVPPLPPMPTLPATPGSQRPSRPHKA